MEIKPCTLRCLLMAGTLCTPAALPAQMAGPISGVVYQSATRSLRPILGVPGGAVLGNAVLSDADAALVCPSGNAALVHTGGRAGIFIGLRRGPVVELPSADLLIDADSAAWSGNSSVLVTGDASRGLVRWALVGGGGVELSAATEVFPSGQRVKVLAVSEDGATAVVTASGDSGKASFLADGVQGRRKIDGIGEASVALFAPKSGRVYLLDGEGRRIVVAGSSGDTIVSIPLQNQPADGTLPAGLALGADEKQIFVVWGANARLQVYDADSAALVRELVPDAPADRAVRLSGSSLFLIRAGGQADESLLVLDTRETGGVFLIPSWHPSTAGAQ
jgi:DNA-binding beta-propeller fold protein YncE